MTNGHRDALRPTPAHVTHERLDGEVIAVHLGTGRYYSMSGPAADVWWLMDSGVAREQWPRLLELAYGAPVPVDEVEGFVHACVTAELVQPGSASSHQEGLALPNDFPRSTWTTPALEEFDDLRDLILVDPVHDTSALGWPHVDG